MDPLSSWTLHLTISKNPKPRCEATSQQSCLAILSHSHRAHVQIDFTLATHPFYCVNTFNAPQGTWFDQQ